MPLPVFPDLTSTKGGLEVGGPFPSPDVAWGEEGGRSGCPSPFQEVLRSCANCPGQGCAKPKLSWRTDLL